MCGLSGCLKRSGVKGEISSQVLYEMADQIRHRGPDSNGVWIDDRAIVGLAHTRLSIVELSEAGHQPMHSACDRYVLVFNGEIYNHLSLRKTLQNEGVTFDWKGSSDTETLLACFSVWGIIRTLQSTVGMFALALWDKHTQSLTLARDRLGEKPLYWGWQDEVLLFGSELKSLKAHPSFNAKICRQALALLLRNNYISAPFSIYQGIEKLKPGHFITISADSKGKLSKSEPYWSVNSVVEAGGQNLFSGSDDEAIAILEERLGTAVSEQMLADVPLGAFLSGGVDSSTIVALMQKNSSRPVRTFTIGFEEALFNEAEHALAVSNYLKTEHTEVYVSAIDALKLIPDLPKIYCEPFADSSQIPTFLVSQMAKQHVTVALSGDAGDELFGGYNPYQFSPKLWRVLHKIPQPIRGTICQFGRSLPLSAKPGKLFEVGDAATKEELYRRLISHWADPAQIIIDTVEPTTLINQPTNWPVTDSFEHWMMAVDTQMYMVDDILVKVDRAAMANSLETRVPLLDHRVVEFAWKLPLSMKIRDGKGKWILRELLYRHVPRELIERPKKGFSIPLGSWLKGPLREWAESLLDPALLVQQGYFHPGPIRKIWQQHLTGKYDRSRQLWSILMFQAWLQEQ